MKFRITATYEYPADPEDYGTNDPKEMMDIDRPDLWEILSFAYHDASFGGVALKLEQVSE